MANRLSGRPGTRRFGPKLAEELHVRTLYVRYNSGLHLSENGRALHQLLSELVTTYPEAIGDLVLVGHSMGGLVIRSAGHYASLREELGVKSEELAEKQKRNANTATSSAKSKTLHSQLLTLNSTWLPHLRQIFLLGTPNDGSWLEQNSHLTARLLQRINLFPTRFLSRAINQRSNGIKDLRHSVLVDEDWQHERADDLHPPRTLVPPLPGVTYHILLGSWLKASRPAALRQYLAMDWWATAVPTARRCLATKPRCHPARRCAPPSLPRSTTAGCCYTRKCIST